SRTLTFRSGIAASFKGSRKLDAEIDAPKFLNSKVFADIYAVRHNYFDLSYYGSGPDSEKGGRTRYHLEDKAIDGRIAVRPFRNFTAGASLGYVTTEAGLWGNSNYTRVGTF